MAPNEKRLTSTSTNDDDDDYDDDDNDKVEHKRRSYGEDDEGDQRGDEKDGCRKLMQKCKDDNDNSDGCACRWKSFVGYTHGNSFSGH